MSARLPGISSAPLLASRIRTSGSCSPGMVPPARRSKGSPGSFPGCASPAMYPTRICRPSTRPPTCSSTPLARSAGGSRCRRPSPAASPWSPRRAWERATTCSTWGETASSTRPAITRCWPIASARRWRSTGRGSGSGARASSPAGTTRPPGATSCGPRRAWHHDPPVGPGHHPQRGGERRALPAERPRLRRPGLRARLGEQGRHGRDRPPVRRGPDPGLRPQPDHPLDLPMGAGQPPPAQRLGADPGGRPGGDAGAPGGDRGSARPAGRRPRGRLLHPPQADLPRQAAALRRVRQQGPAEALPAQPLRARPGRAGHPGLRARPGRPPAGAPGGMERQGGLDPVLPPEAPPLCRGVRPGGIRAPPRGHPLEDGASPVRDPGREDPLDEVPLLPYASVPPTVPVLPLSVLLPAGHPGRQDGAHLPFPSGVLVPADRRRAAGGNAAGRTTMSARRAVIAAGTLWVAFWIWVGRYALLDDALIHLRYAHLLRRVGFVTFDGRTASYGTSSPLYVG